MALKDNEKLMNKLPEIRDRFRTKPYNRLVIEGNAGVGKSMLLRSFAYEWSQERLWNEYECVLFINLEEVEVYKDLSLEELMKEKSTLLHDGERDWSKVLWVLDGWDKVEIQGVLKAIEQNEEPRVEKLIVATRPVNYRMKCDSCFFLLGLYFEPKYNTHEIERVQHKKDGISEYVRMHFGYWSQKDKKKAANTMALCLKRLGYPWNSISRLVWRAVMRLRLEVPLKARKVLSRIDNELCLEEICANPTILKMVCEAPLEWTLTRLYKSMVDKMVPQKVLGLLRKVAYMAWEADSTSLKVVVEAFCDLLNFNGFIHSSFRDFLAAGCLANLSMRHVICDSVTKEKNNLFNRFFFGVCKESYFYAISVGKIPVSASHLGPYEWVAEDETGKLREKLDFHTKDEDLNLADIAYKAAERGLYESVKCLAFHESVDLCELLACACRSGSLEAVRFLMENAGAHFDDECEGLDLAAQNGHLDVCKYLLEQDEPTSTALALASGRGNNEVVRLLVEHGVYVNDVSSGVSPLVLSISFGHEDVALYLVDSGADVNQATTEGIETPLMVAISNNMITLTKVLVSKGADVNAKTSTGKLTSSHAWKRDLLAYLINHGAKLDKDYFSCFMETCGDRDMLKFLMQQGVGWSKALNACAEEQEADICLAIAELAEEDKGFEFDRLTLSQALVSGLRWLDSSIAFSGKQIQTLIYNGANVHYRSDGESALMRACSERNVEAVEVLLKHGANVNDISDNKDSMVTPLICACRVPCAKSYSIAKLLLEHKADVNTKGTMDGEEESPLWATINSGFASLELLKLLVENGADVHERDSCKRTVLYPSLSFRDSKRNIAQISFFLDQGVDINAQDDFGNTMLFEACKTSDTEVLELLVSRGADLGLKNGIGDNCLMGACESCRRKCTRWLVEKQMNVNEQNQFGTTALMYAARSSNVEMLEYLLSVGANVEHRDEKGWSAIWYAASCFNDKIFRALCERGADWKGVDDEKLTVLMIACQRARGRANRDFVEWLLRNGADETAEDGNGWTAMTHACANGKLEIVRLFKAWKGNASGVLGYHMACSHGCLEVVKYLIDEGVGVNATFDGLTALHRAKQKNHQKIAQFLEKRGAFPCFVMDLVRCQLRGSSCEAANVLIFCHQTVYGFGENSRGQVFPESLCRTISYLEPHQITLPKQINSKLNVSGACVGDLHMLIWLDNGLVFGQGSDALGQLGFINSGERKKADFPRLIVPLQQIFYFEDKNAALLVKQCWASNRGSYFGCRSGEIYVCGDNEYGQLDPTSDEIEFSCYRKLERFGPKHPLRGIVCTNKNSLFLTTSGDILFTTGRPGQGGMGFRCFNVAKSHKLLSGKKALSIRSVALVPGDAQKFIFVERRKAFVFDMSTLKSKELLLDCMEEIVGVCSNSSLMICWTEYGSIFYCDELAKAGPVSGEKWSRWEIPEKVSEVCCTQNGLALVSKAENKVYFTKSPGTELAVVTLPKDKLTVRPSLGGNLCEMLYWRKELHHLGSAYTKEVVFTVLLVKRFGSVAAFQNMPRDVLFLILSYLPLN